MTTGLLPMWVKSITVESAGVHSFDLRPADRGELPRFAAGAHIDVHLPTGLVRSYSLVNSQEERHRYVVAVQKDPAGRGGSRFLHDSVRAGDSIEISAPRNNFELNENADHSVFISGGIGVTPLWCMIQRLDVLGRSWTLHYCARTREAAPFLDQIRSIDPSGHERVHVNFDHEPGGRLLDVDAVVESAPSDAQLYCCGPAPMLEAFTRATAALPAERVHLEYFTAKVAPPSPQGFTVKLARSGRRVVVPAGESILDSLLDNGITVPYSCMEGVCSTCETRVLEGVPEHRDLVLSRDERESNKVMMICCSRSLTDELVLDL